MTTTSAWHITLAVVVGICLALGAVLLSLYNVPINN